MQQPTEDKIKQNILTHFNKNTQMEGEENKTEETRCIHEEPEGDNETPHNRERYTRTKRA